MAGEGGAPPPCIRWDRRHCEGVGPAEKIPHGFGGQVKPGCGPRNFRRRPGFERTCCPGSVSHAGIASFEFFHKVAHGREALGELVYLPPELLEMFEEKAAAGRGMVAVSAHLGALDLAGVAFTVTDFQVQVISYAAPPAGYRLVNELRNDHGLVITPGSKEALAQATARLESAGVVFTAVDRPVPPGRKATEVQFFGRSTRLWNGYATMAFATGALLFFVWVERSPAGRYAIRFNEPIDCADPPGDVDHVTSLILQQAEDAIRANPDQWLMFFPVWPRNESAEAVTLSDPGPGDET